MLHIYFKESSYCTYSNVQYEESLKSFEIRVGHSPGFGLPFCRDKAMIVQKATYSNIYSLTPRSVIF